MFSQSLDSIKEIALSVSPLKLEVVVGQENEEIGLSLVVSSNQSQEHSAEDLLDGESQVDL